MRDRHLHGLELSGMTVNDDKGETLSQDLGSTRNKTLVEITVFANANVIAGFTSDE